MITQIAEHFGYHAVFLDETHVAGMTKIDMSALIQQGMIYISRDYYSMVIHKRFNLALPNPDRVSISDCTNWLFVSADHDEEEGYDVDNVVSCKTMNEDDQHQEQFIPPHQDPTQQGVGSSSMN